MLRITCLLFLGWIFSQDTNAQVRQLNLLGHWSDSTLVGSRAYDNTYNEIWGLAVNDREFAVIGSTAGTHIIDVTDPGNAVEVQFIAGAVQGTPVIHRDYHDFRGYLYAACDEGASTLQIIDITGLPDTVTVVYDSNEFFGRAHNIFIDTMHARLYVHIARGGDLPATPMMLLDISTPDTPRYVNSYNRFGPLNVSQVHDGYIEDHLAYLNCGPAGFALVDMTDPDTPVTLSTLTPDDYPFAGYNHSGWPNCSGQYYYMADENHDFDMKVIDVRDPANLAVTGTFNADSDSALSIPHNQLVACDYLYVSYYYDGLQVYDISDPADPVRVAHYPTSSLPHRRTYEGAWGVYPYLPSGNILVSDMQEGLFVIEPIGDNCYTEQTCSISTYVKNTQPHKLTIYPNPSDGSTLRWRTPRPLTGATLDFKTLHGGTVFSRALPHMDSESSVDLPGHLTSGVYIVQISSATDRYIGTWLVLP